MSVNLAEFSLPFVAAIGAGLIAGVFFAFSTFVMRALERRPATEGIAAMQAINVCVLNPWFFSAFFGTAVVCLAAAVHAALRWNESGAAFSLAGAALYLLGTVAVTGAFNVPRNERLASLRPCDPDAPSLWARYVETWTAWNHVRTASSLAAAAAFTAALVA